MGDTPKKTIWHNIVYSAKGGCGKTTFSTLFRVISIPKTSEQNDQINFEETNLILLDLDLLASNLGDYETEFIERAGKKESDAELIHYLLSGNKLCDEPFAYKGNCKLNSDAVDSSEKFAPESFMLITAPRTESERGYFKSKRRYLPVVKFDEFKYGLTSLIKKICRSERTKIEKIEQQYEKDIQNIENEENQATLIAKKKENLEKELKKELNIVYDLPPNSDGFTEIVFDILLNYKSDIRKEKGIEHKVRLFVLSNGSDSILKVNLIWLYNFLNESGSNVVPDSTYLLVNLLLTNQSPYVSQSTLNDNSFNKIIRELEKKKVICCEFKPITVPIASPIKFEQKKISDMIHQLTNPPPKDTNDNINTETSD